jgi:hypothetical protein
MYACEMQICCYSSVKYYVGIKFHIYHTHMISIGHLWFEHLYGKKICLDLSIGLYIYINNLIINTYVQFIFLNVHSFLILTH